MKNHYSILGVPYKATQNEVVTAYKLLAKKYHPDKNPSPAAHDKFIEIHEAYTVLKDPGRRYKYDRSLFIRQPRPKTSPGSDRYYCETPEEVSPARTVISTPLVIMVSFLGIVITALVGASIIAAPALLYFVFDFIPGVPARMFILIILAIPYWYWLYRKFEKYY